MISLNSLSSIFTNEICLICGELLLDQSRNYPLCPECEADLHLIQSKCCSLCGQPLISEKTLCLRCRDSSGNYNSNRSLFIYEGNIKELIYQYKFNNRKMLSRYFAKQLSKILKSDFSGSMIVPVPGRKIIYREKGWEHIELICSCLNQIYDMSYMKILTRKGVKAQKTLTKEMRAENLRKTITLKNGIKNLPESIVLLDDVFTTGTTINECSGILKSAGALVVRSLTLAVD